MSSGLSVVRRECGHQLDFKLCPTSSCSCGDDASTLAQKRCGIAATCTTLPRDRSSLRRDCAAGIIHMYFLIFTSFRVISRQLPFFSYLVSQAQSLLPRLDSRGSSAQGQAGFFLSFVCSLASSRGGAQRNECYARNSQVRKGFVA